MRKTITILVLGVIILGLIIACDNEGPVENDDLSVEYTLFYIDTMPCVWAKEYKAGGITCDWSRWTGE